MKVAVIVYPGSNADFDAQHAVAAVLGVEPQLVFHKERDLGSVDAVIVPGGFSYGDYLRAGAIARFSPISEALVDFAKRGGPVLGICNGFQILTELGLLPGALARNRELRFECRDVWVRVESGGAFTHEHARGEVLRLPISHAEGRYHCDRATLTALVEQERIALRYCDPAGEVTGHPSINPNGSMDNVAGVYNEERNVLGLMPHPERAAELVLGNRDGRAFFLAMREWIQANDKSEKANGN